MSVRKNIARKLRGKKAKNQPKTRASKASLKVILSSKPVSKEEAKYRNKPAIVNFPVLGKVYYTCDGCRYWNGERFDDKTNTCTKVKGQIKPNAVCDLWMFGRPQTEKSLSEKEKKQLMALSESFKKDDMTADEKKALMVLAIGAPMLALAGGLVGSIINIGKAMMDAPEDEIKVLTGLSQLPMIKAINDIELIGGTASEDWTNEKWGLVGGFAVGTIIGLGAIISEKQKTKNKKKK